MIQFACDSCGKVKKPTSIWILGRAAEAVGITVVRREVDILSATRSGHFIGLERRRCCTPACRPLLF